MTTSVITKTLAKPELQDRNMSIGFRRFFVLPNRVKKAIQLAYMLEHGLSGSQKHIVGFFASMTEVQYVNYMKNA